MNKIKPYLPLLILVSLGILAWVFDIQHYINFETLQKNQKFIKDFIYQHYIWSLIIFSTLYIIIVALSIPGATIMTVTAGFLFGQMMGMIVSVMSATIGATILFLSLRLVSEKVIAQRAKTWIEKMQKGFQKNALSYLVTLRLIPLFPFVAINLVASVLQIPLKTFFFGTLIGIIPGSFVFASMGVALHHVIEKPGFTPSLILDSSVILALTGLGILSLLPVAYKYFHKRRRSKKS